MPVEVALARRSSRSPSTAELDHRLALFGQLLQARFGLTFPESRANALRRAVAAGMEEKGLASDAAYLALVASDASALARLACLSTTGETYFFRHPEQLAAIGSVVLPVILRDRAADPDRVVRAWSAGCATGEEAYSLAMILQEGLLTAAGWSARIAGSDLGADAIARAVSGSYGRWSFREMDERWSGWFTKRAGGRVTVDARVRPLVTFSVQNLADPAACPPADLGGPADLVVCRNVLMYLDQDAAQRVVDLIYRALRPGGWLVVGVTEIAPHFFRRFERTFAAGVTAYRRPHAESGPARSRRPAVAALAAPAPAAPAGPPARRRPLVLAPTPRSEQPMARARRLADEGRHAEARAICAAIMRVQPGDVPARQLLADLAEAEGDLPATRAALGALLARAPQDMLVQLRLALIERRLGHHSASQRLLADLVARTSELPDEAQLDQVGELSAGRLRSIAATMLHARLDE